MEARDGKSLELRKKAVASEESETQTNAIKEMILLEKKKYIETELQKTQNWMNFWKEKTILK